MLVHVVKTILTSPLDLQKDAWGLSLLKLQASLPDTMPGQNVMFLIYGNTSIENAAENMQVFYFTTGFGDLKCKEAPQDAIVVRSPEHMQMTFTANGVKVSIASTVVLRAMRNKSLQVQLIEGHATVTTPIGSQTLLPGQLVYVALGGKTGLEPITAPSSPIAALPDSRLTPLIELLDRLDGTQRSRPLIAVSAPSNGGSANDGSADANPSSESNNTNPDNGNVGSSDSGSSGGGGGGGGGSGSNPGPTVVPPTPVPGQPTAVPTTGAPTKPPKPTYVPKAPKPTYTPKPTKIP